MPNKAYGRGRALEYQMKDKLEKQGYFVVRAAGSHGVADLVAIDYGPQNVDLVIKHLANRIDVQDNLEAHEILFISCKIPQYAPPAERKALLDAAARFGAIPMMTKKNPKGQWELQRLDT
jgi:Holliday junction resolvase